jgi:hypothetical protein
LYICLSLCLLFFGGQRKVAKESPPCNFGPKKTGLPSIRWFPWRDQKLASFSGPPLLSALSSPLSTQRGNAISPLKQFVPLFHGNQRLSAALQWGVPLAFINVVYGEKVEFLSFIE